MRERRLIEAEGSIDFRMDHALAPKVEQFISPASHPIDLTPHVAKINPEDALVCIEKRQRCEQKPGRGRQSSEGISKNRFP